MHLHNKSNNLKFPYAIFSVGSIVKPGILANAIFVQFESAAYCKDERKFRRSFSVDFRNQKLFERSGNKLSENKRSEKGRAKAGKSMFGIFGN